MGVTVEENQSMFDIALLYCGTTESAFEIAALNDLSVTEFLTPAKKAAEGQVVSFAGNGEDAESVKKTENRVLTVPPVADKRNVDRLQLFPIKVSSDATEWESKIPEGIGYWEIWGAKSPTDNTKYFKIIKG